MDGTIKIGGRDGLGEGIGIKRRGFDCAGRVRGHRFPGIIFLFQGFTKEGV
jgi:hypothetical protein